MALKHLILLLVLSLSAWADSFDPFQVIQPNGTIVLNASEVTSIGWTFGPHEISGSSSPWLCFLFPIPPVHGELIASLFVGGEMRTFSFPIDASAQLIVSGIFAIAGLELPRYYGARAGWVQFEFAGTTSSRYGFTLVQPIPEPASLWLLGTGLIGVWKFSRHGGARPDKAR